MSATIKRGLFSLVTFYLSINIHAQQLKVVSSASIFNDMAQRLGGNLIDAKAIVPIGSDPHTYEPTPSDAKDIMEADIILVNGMTFEGWMDEVISNSGTRGKRILITEGISPIASEQYQGSVDPHAWMDAMNGVVYITNIYQALVDAAPQHAEAFTANYEKYKNEISDLDEYITKEIKRIPEAQRVLITSHDAFSYYSKKYGIINNAIMGISTESDAQTSDIMRVANAIKKYNVPAIFVESTINPKMINQIAKDNNVAIGGELYADSIGEPGSSGDTYIKMLKHNTDTIVKALSTPSSLQQSDDREDNSTGVLLLIGLGLITAIGIIIYLIFKK